MHLLHPGRGAHPPVVVLPPWRPRAFMVAGDAEALTETKGAGGEPLGAIIRIHPVEAVSWVLDTTTSPPRALPIAKGDRPCAPAPRRSRSLLRGLTAAGIATVAANQTRCIGHFAGLTTAQLFKPQFQDIEKVAVFARIFDHLIMSRTGTPPAPLFIGNGLSDPTGDGVMVTKDVQELAYTYCQRGVPVELHIYSGLDHQQTGPPFLDQAQVFLTQRFAHRPVQNGCGEIGPGDSIAPVPAPAP